MEAGERQEEQPAGLSPCSQLVSQAWGCTIPFGTFPALSCLSPGTWENSLPPLHFILFSWHNPQPQSSSLAQSSPLEHINLSLQSPSKSQSPSQPHVPAAGAQQVAGRRHRALQEPAHPPCPLPSPGVWKLSATSWLPQIHMGRGS